MFHLPLSIESNQGEFFFFGIDFGAGFVSRNYTVTVKTQDNELACYVSQTTCEESKNITEAKHLFLLGQTI